MPAQQHQASSAAPQTAPAPCATPLSSAGSDSAMHAASAAVERAETVACRALPSSTAQSVELPELLAPLARAALAMRCWLPRMP